MDFTPSARTTTLLVRLRAFLRDELIPIEREYWEALRREQGHGDWRRWRVPAVMDALREKARAAGLWNLFFSDPQLGAGLSTLEYAPLAEEMGRHLMAPEVFNCSAPDAGNVEVLWKYGSDAQKERWMMPLLAGEIRSVFCMTEPEVASSDATNMQATGTLDGDHIVVHGRKGWATNLGHPNARFAIVMVRTSNEAADRHHQHSMVLVPLDAHGVTIERMLPVYGEYDAPNGYGEVLFDQVRVPRDHVIAAIGEGFPIAQGRLGPGRIHHCMRCIGAAEEALGLMIDRGASRKAFGHRIVSLGGNRERIAEARIAIDQARVYTLYAAWRLDQVGAMAAMSEISAIKVIAPNVLERVVDDAIQLYGSAGLSHDTPLAGLFAQARALRLVDGPDEVHKGLIARLELLRRGHKP